MFNYKKIISLFIVFFSVTILHAMDQQAPDTGAQSSLNNESKVVVSQAIPERSQGESTQQEVQATTYVCDVPGCSRNFEDMLLVRMHKFTQHRTVVRVKHGYTPLTKGERSALLEEIKNDPEIEIPDIKSVGRGGFCLLCKRFFHRVNRLKKHYKNLHAKEGVFWCDKNWCNELFGSEQELNNHVQNWHEIDLNSLPTENGIISQNTNTHAPQNHHTDLNQDKSPQDSHEFGPVPRPSIMPIARNDFNQNITSVGQLPINSYKCPICPARFNRPEQLASHRKTCASGSYKLTDAQDQGQQESEINMQGQTQTSNNVTPVSNVLNNNHEVAAPQSIAETTNNQQEEAVMFRCDITGCPKVYSEEVLLLMHKLSHHKKARGYWNTYKSLDKQQQGKIVEELRIKVPGIFISRGKNVSLANIVRGGFCLICKKRFIKKERLAEHYKDKHVKEGDFWCDKNWCYDFFETEQDLKDHLENWHHENHVERTNCHEVQNNVISADECAQVPKDTEINMQGQAQTSNNVTLVSNALNNNHEVVAPQSTAEITNNQQEEAVMFRCDITGCPKVYSEEVLLLMHKLSHHKKAYGYLNPYKSLDKQQQGKIVEELRIKVPGIFISRGKNVSLANILRGGFCLICKKRFMKKVSLEKHYKDKHVKEGDFWCDKNWCYDFFETEQDLKDHLENWHSANCNQISDMTHVPQNNHINLKYASILNHLDKAQTIKDYMCNIDNCRAGHVSKRRLKDHIIASHKDFDVFWCDKDGRCNGYCENDKIAILKHNVTYHKEQSLENCSEQARDNFIKRFIELSGTALPENQILNSYYCEMPTCKKSFKSINRLKKHQRKSTCSFLTDEGKAAQALIKLRVYREKKQTKPKSVFLCNVDKCPQIFKNKDEMIKHLEHDHAHIKFYLCNHNDCSGHCIAKPKLVIKHLFTYHRDAIKQEYGQEQLEILLKKMKTIAKVKDAHEDMLIQYYCDVDGCKKSYLVKGSLYNHKRRMHKGLDNSKSLTPHQPLVTIESVDLDSENEDSSNNLLINSIILPDAPVAEQDVSHSYSLSNSQMGLISLLPEAANINQEQGAFLQQLKDSICEAIKDKLGIQVLINMAKNDLEKIQKAQCAQGIIKILREENYLKMLSTNLKQQLLQQCASNKTAGTVGCMICNEPFSTIEDVALHIENDHSVFLPLDESGKDAFSKNV